MSLVLQTSPSPLGYCDLSTLPESNRILRGFNPTLYRSSSEWILSPAIARISIFVQKYIFHVMGGRSIFFELWLLVQRCSIVCSAATHRRHMSVVQEGLEPSKRTGFKPASCAVRYCLHWTVFNHEVFVKTLSAGSASARPGSCFIARVNVPLYFVEKKFVERSSSTSSSFFIGTL